MKRNTNALLLNVLRKPAALKIIHTKNRNIGNFSVDRRRHRKGNELWKMRRWRFAVDRGKERERGVDSNELEQIAAICNSELFRLSIPCANYHLDRFACKGTLR